MLPTSNTSAQITECTFLHPNTNTNTANPVVQQKKSPLDYLEENSVCTAEGNMGPKTLGYSARNAVNDVSTVSPRDNVILDKNDDSGGKKETPKTDSHATPH